MNEEGVDEAGMEEARSLVRAIARSFEDLQQLQVAAQKLLAKNAHLQAQLRQHLLAYADQRTIASALSAQTKNTGEASPMSKTYQTKKPGDILRLSDSLPYYEPPVEAGGYVLVSVGDQCCLAALVEDAQGKFCSSNRMVYVSIGDLSCFVATGMRVDPVG